eukprot:TRINITY_DN3747_c0_g1_i1.p1 TRINITY_DN3747_c0_g1~~TRINITY_DN3747_c0_g1_i1.p1  ORF type:complete len:313 (-),score=80.16 TRINITY_DN3747_c0_g1_i1:240-1178(-)
MKRKLDVEEMVLGEEKFHFQPLKLPFKHSIQSQFAPWMNLDESFLNPFQKPSSCPSHCMSIDESLRKEPNLNAWTSSPAFSPFIPSEKTTPFQFHFNASQSDVQSTPVPAPIPTPQIVSHLEELQLTFPAHISFLKDEDSFKVEGIIFAVSSSTSHPLYTNNPVEGTHGLLDLTIPMTLLQDLPLSTKSNLRTLLLNFKNYPFSSHLLKIPCLLEEEPILLALQRAGRAGQVRLSKLSKSLTIKLDPDNNHHHQKKEDLFYHQLFSNSLSKPKFRVVAQTPMPFGAKGEEEEENLSFVFHIVLGIICNVICK